MIYLNWQVGSFLNILSADWFRLVYSPMFYPSKFPTYGGTFQRCNVSLLETISCPSGLQFTMIKSQNDDAFLQIFDAK